MGSLCHEVDAVPVKVLLSPKDSVKYFVRMRKHVLLTQLFYAYSDISVTTVLFIIFEWIEVSLPLSFSPFRQVWQSKEAGDGLRKPIAGLTSRDLQRLRALAFGDPIPYMLTNAKAPMFCDKCP